MSDEIHRRRRAERIQNVVDLLLRATLPAAVLILATVAYAQNHTIDNLETGITCRSRVNAEVAGISDKITAKTTDLFNAAINHPGVPGHPSPEVVAVNRDLVQLKEQLYPAIERRDQAAESCRR